MNYGQIKRKTLDLLFQRTVAGSEVSADYNCQQDYLNAIPGLINDAVMEIATTVKKIPAVAQAEDLECEIIGDTASILMPADFYQLLSGDMLQVKDGELIHIRKMQVQGRIRILLPKDYVEGLEICYYRYPSQLPDSPVDTAYVDNTPDTHNAIPYYVASYLVAKDDSFLCSLFRNTFADKVSQMSPGITADMRVTDDAYGGFYDAYNGVR